MENIETLLAAVAQTQGFDEDEPAVSTATGLGLEKSESSTRIQDDSGDARLSAVVDVPIPSRTPAFPGAGLVIDAVEKKKRGRPKGQLAVKPPPSKRSKLEEEEDVCFICFDGGSLVLCDRKGCPKAYHPACIKRDEAFFQSKAKWNCGWHICSVCRRASHFVCYTCTYSLCKGCINDADYLCVRRNSGFCSICMKTIMLIENKDQADNESVQVDFDDITSWEYLFKVYWVILKEKLSLTLDELTQAKNPWKGVATVGHKPLLRNAIPSAVSVEGPVSYSSTEHLESNKPHVEFSFPQNETAPPSTGINMEKINNDTWECGPAHNKDMAKSIMDEVKMSIDKATDIPCITESTHQPVFEKGLDEASIVQDTEKKCICKNTNNKESDKTEINSSTEWATKDLLEFVAHMKNGDTSAIPQFDVQTLLLDYIKRNNLRDPRRKSQIICDQRLNNLFGKPRVGHIEMLKLLEFHFLMKEDSKKDSFIPAGLVSSDASEMEVDGNTYGLLMPINSRKRKSRRKSDERAPSQNNLNEYAAIDVHNINLIYLRRNLMENLIEDHENFNNKVIGSIVRIKISSNDQKQDVHRLVQVVGTTKADEPYKIGNNTADVMLEVLNLDKKEVVSINAITNQEFTEDECRRLRQSIRCGLVKHFTVGEVQNKAMALQPVRVNDWLEAEISRLNHLRDRASENGRKKELRDHVTKLQLLKSPNERIRRISEIPEIHADPKMSPDYESEEETKSGDNSRKDDYVRPSYLSVPLNGRNPISPNKKDKEERTIQTRNRAREKTDASRSSNSDKHMNQVNITNLVTGGRNIQATQRSGLEHVSMGNSPSSSIIETEKLWHYRDPNGKIQGSFSMVQLRKWNTTGLFPPNMRIWTNHEQYDSLLLTDALNGKFNLPSDLSNSGSLEEEATTGAIEVVSEGTNVRSRDSSKYREPALSSNVIGLISEVTNVISRDSKQTESALGSNVIGLLSEGAISEGSNLSSRDSKQAEQALGSNVIGLISEGTNVSSRDSKQTEPALGTNVRGLISEGTIVSGRYSSKQTEPALGSDLIGLIREGTDVSSRDSKQTDPALGSNVIGLISEDTKTSAGTNVSSRDSKQTAQALGSNVLTLVSEGTNMSSRDSKQTGLALDTNVIGLISEGTNVSSRASSKQTEPALGSNVVGLISEGTNVSSRDSSKQTEPALGMNVIGLITEGTNVSSRESKKTEPPLGSDVIGLISEGTNVSSINNSKQTDPALGSNVIGLISDGINMSTRDSSKETKPASGSDVIDLVSEGTNVSSGDSKQAEPALASSMSVSFENNIGLEKADESGGSWPQCWDLLKDNNSNVNNDVQARDFLPPLSPEKTPAALPDSRRESESGENNSTGLTENPLTTGDEFQNLTNDEECVKVPSEENLKSLNIDLSLNDMECGSVSAHDSDKPSGNLSVLDLLSPTPRTVDIEQSDVPIQNFEILELLSPTPRLNNEDQATETKQSEFINFPAQIWSNASSLGLGDVELPEIDEWRGYSPTPTKPPENMSENVATSTSNIPTWLMTINETIELDAFGEESVSDLLAEVDAMESQGALPSPTSAMKFARELLEDCKDDCFSSIEEFSRKSDAFSSTSEIQLNSEPSCKPMINTTFDFLTRSSMHSSASSEGETNNNAPVYSGDPGLEFHHFPVPNIAQEVVGANMGPGMGSDCVDPSWGTVQGNINLVTVQGNVNLVLGGPAAQGMANLGWGTNQGTGWVNPNLNLNPGNGIGSLSWDGQRKYGGERFTSPRDWGGFQGCDSGFGRGRPSWGRQPPYGGGGYSRAVLKGQRVCKFYGSGHCRKGAFCDYLHP